MATVDELMQLRQRAVGVLEEIDEGLKGTRAGTTQAESLLEDLDHDEGLLRWVLRYDDLAWARVRHFLAELERMSADDGINEIGDWLAP